MTKTAKVTAPEKPNSQIEYARELVGFLTTLKDDYIKDGFEPDSGITATLKESADLISNMLDQINEPLYAKRVRDGEAHYYVSSATTWKVSTNMQEAMDIVKKADRDVVKRGGYAGTNMTVCFVPLPIDAKYQISDYMPEVDGMVVLASIDYRDELEKYSKRLTRNRK